MKRYSLLLLGLLLLLPACDSSKSDSDSSGKSFDAKVTGARTAEFGGSALAVESHDVGVSWGVSLTDLDTGYKILFAWDAATPATGTYSIAGSSTSSSFEALLILDDLLGQYVGTGGTFTITSSSDTRVVGSFSFTAEYGGLDQVKAGTEVSVTGTFSSSNAIDHTSE